MKKIFVFSCFITAACQLLAQTKEIAFKSHSGRPELFQSILGNELFDTDSDFGVAPVTTIRNAELDSVIFVSDSVAIMVTSEYCRYEDRSTRKQVHNEHLWQAGSKKVYKHPLFSKKHSLDSIKNILRLKYNFRNPVEKTVFVGYDNGDCPDTQYFSPLPATAPDNKDQSPFDSSIVSILGLALGLSLLGGWITWRYV